MLAVYNGKHKRKDVRIRWDTNNFILKETLKGRKVEEDQDRIIR